MSRTGAVGRKLENATKLGNMPPDMIRRIANLGGPNVSMRMATTSASMRAATDVSAEVKTVRESLLSRLRTARRAFAKSSAPYTRRLGGGKVLSGRHEALHTLGRIGKSNFVINHSTGSPKAHFKVAGRRFMIDVRRLTFDGLYIINVATFRKAAGNEWSAEPLVNLTHELCLKTKIKGPRTLTTAQVRWHRGGLAALDPVARLAIRQAVDIFRPEMTPALSWC